jgi:hypothetical protein
LRWRTGGWLIILLLKNSSHRLLYTGCRKMRSTRHQLCRPGKNVAATPANGTLLQVDAPAANAAAQFRLKSLYSLSREELYHQFNKFYPEFVQRIPQYLLASFLGFTPEYLSEIRRKAIS